MAGTLLVPPSGIPLERLVQMAMERGYTAQGEMFSGELGAEGSQAWCSSPGMDWRGWVGQGTWEGLVPFLRPFPPLSVTR